MPVQTMYIGSFGPFQFNDDNLFKDGSHHRMHLTRTPLLDDDIVRLADIGGVIGSVIQIVPTGTIGDPVELNGLTGSGDGALAIVAETTGAALDPMTLYAWNSDPGAAPENPPYTVDGGGVNSMWIALSGLYINQDANFNANIIMQNLATVDGVDVSAHAANVDAHHDQIHAPTHVTGGGDTVADVVAAGNSGLMDGGDKTKLDGIESGATTDQTGLEIVVLLEALLAAARLSHDDGLSDVSSDDHHDEVHIFPSHSDVNLAGIANNDLVQYNDPATEWRPKSIQEVILSQNINPGNITMNDGAWIGIGAAFERLIFDATGYISVVDTNFGIGFSTAPGTLLHLKRDVIIGISAQNNYQLLIQNPSDVANHRAGIGFAVTSGASIGAAIQLNRSTTGGSRGNLNFITRGAATTDVRISIAEDGDVGFGTILPQAHFDNLGTARLGDSTTNYLAVSATGVITLVGTARVIRSIKLFATISKPAATAPTEVIIGDFLTLQYSNAGPLESAKFLFHIPEDWAQGTDMEAHIHWAPATGAGGNVKWDINYTALASEANEVLTAAGVAITITDATQALQDELLQSPNMTLTAANIASEDTIGLTLSRDNTVGGNYGAAASFVLIEIEYISDRLGL